MIETAIFSHRKSGLRHFPASWILALAFLLLQPGATRLGAQVAKPGEYQVKAAYLSNFGKFVDWPARPGAPKDEVFNICVIGDDPFGGALDAALEGETIDHAPLVARRSQKPEDATGCIVQFVLEGNKVRFEINLAAAQRLGLKLSSELLKLAVAVRRTP
jgi:hypothetical protein